MMENEEKEVQNVEKEDLDKEKFGERLKEQVPPEVPQSLERWGYLELRKSGKARSTEKLNKLLIKTARKRGGFVSDNNVYCPKGEEIVVLIDGKGKIFDEYGFLETAELASRLQSNKKEGVANG